MYLPGYRNTWYQINGPLGYIHHFPKHRRKTASKDNKSRPDKRKACPAQAFPSCSPPWPGQQCGRLRYTKSCDILNFNDEFSINLRYTSLTFALANHILLKKLKICSHVQVLWVLFNIVMYSSSNTRRYGHILLICMWYYQKNLFLKHMMLFLLSYTVAHSIFFFYKIVLRYFFCQY